MNGWFIALVVLQVLGLGVAMAKHGEKRTDSYNFWGMLIGSLISLFLVYMAIQTGF